MAPDEIMLPRPFRVVSTACESHDVVTLTLESEDGVGVSFLPGQFTMLYVLGVGEVPISLSGDPREPRAVHTIRSVGAVTRALCASDVGAIIGLRGPFGNAWPLNEARGGDLIIIAGGIGIAPLRSAIYTVLADRDAYDRIAILYGARTPSELLYVDELSAWAAEGDVQVLTTVDAANEAWTGVVGVVPALVARADFDPESATALVCGPEVMLRFTVRALRRAGLSHERVHVSLERNMACAIGLCGHCQLGPEFICMDGPVFAYPRVAESLSIPEV